MDVSYAPFASRRRTFADADAQIGALDFYSAQVGALTATRAATLPAASAARAGKWYTVVDESRSLRPWLRIHVTPAGGDTIEGVNAYSPLIWPGESITLVSDGVSAWTVVARSHSRGLLDTSRRGVVILDDDFHAIAGALTATGSTSAHSSVVIGSGGGGGQASAKATDDGAIVLKTAASGSSLDRAWLRVLGQNDWVCGNGLLLCEWTVYGTIAAPTLGAYFSLAAGFHNGITGNSGTAFYPSNGCYWAVDPLVSTTNLLCVTSNGGTKTAVDSGVTIASAVRLGVEIAVDGSSAQFFANDVLKITTSTNLPTPGSFTFGAIGGFSKITGADNGLEVVAWDRVRVYAANNVLRVS